MLVLWPHITDGQWDLLKDIAAIIGALLATATALVKVIGWIRPRWREWRDRATLRHRVGAELYDPEQIRRSVEYYIRPDCQSIDPAGGEEFRRVVSAREPLFATLDRMLQNPSQYKFVILLADSGMGKTSFLLNYYAYHHYRSTRHRYPLSLVPLNLPSSDELIRDIAESERRSTVLCLDALDEDQQAISDHRRRLGQLVELTHGFGCVIITCRSQFFPKEEEIPTEAGLVKIGPVSAGESRNHYFHKLYLSPFTDQQVNKYLRRRFPLWKIHERREAQSIVTKIPDLVARPMLLAHVPDLVHLKRKIDYSFQIYEAMVAGWLERERFFVANVNALRDFSERLAADLFSNRASRGIERIPAIELQPLADRYEIKLEDWQLRGRSLLNRDALGSYKFAHRSIMEYLFITAFLKRKVQRCSEPWTDLMKQFLVEILRAESSPSELSKGETAVEQASCRSGGRFTDLRGADLVGKDLTRMSFGEVDLRGANLSGANLSGSNLFKANLADTNLSGADFSGAINLRTANFQGADLSQAVLTNAELTGVNFRGATLRKAELAGASLKDADLSRADLRCANLRSADLSGANLCGADLRETTLSRAHLDRATLKSAHLEGVDFSGLRLIQTLGLTLVQALAVRADKSTQWPVEILGRHSNRVNGLALSLDGRIVVSCSRDNTLKIWDVRRGCELRTLTGHNGPVSGVAISRDGKVAISASLDKTLKVWDVEGGQELRCLVGHTDRVFGVVLSTDGKMAVSASADKTLKVWDVISGRESRSFLGHSGEVAGIALSADGGIAVSASLDRTLKVWDVSSGREFYTLVGHDGPVNSVALSADARIAMSASWDHTLKIWDMKDGRELRTLIGHTGYVYGVSLSVDGCVAASASADKTLKLWNVENGHELYTLQGHTDDVADVVLSVDKRFVISASNDTSIRVWFSSSG
jgi:WD40 repeat protein